jgi:hypothetical protein
LRHDLKRVSKHSGIKQPNPERHALLTHHFSTF